MGRGLGFTVVFEREIEDVRPEQFQGRSLAAHRHALDSIAHEYDLRGIGEFVAFSRTEAETLAEDMKFDAPTTGSQSGRWFATEQAIEVVQAIRRHLDEDPDELDDSARGPVMSELSELESLLEHARARSVRFRLGVEY